MNTQRHQVRIIAGRWRGRKIDFLPSAQLRPTGDKIRETAFNWLQMSINGAICLDLFTGSGIFGFEALSRGASQVVMVDSDPAVHAKITENAERLEANHFQTWTMTIPSEQLNDRLADQKFNIVFIDPPFGKGLVGPACEMLQKSHCLASGALIYIETERALNVLGIPDDWEVLRAKTAGNVAYYLVRSVGQ